MSAAPCPSCDDTTNFPNQPLGTKGDCLEETARHKPAGFARIVYGTIEHQHCEPNNYEPGTPWLSMGAATACMSPAPLTIFIAAGTSITTARTALKEARKWLKGFDTLSGFMPTEPQSAHCDSDDLPF